MTAAGEMAGERVAAPAEPKGTAAAASSAAQRAVHSVTCSGCQRAARSGLPKAVYSAVRSAASRVVRSAARKDEPAPVDAKGESGVEQRVARTDKSTAATGDTWVAARDARKVCEKECGWAARRDVVQVGQWVVRTAAKEATAAAARLDIYSAAQKVD